MCRADPARCGSEGRRRVFPSFAMTSLQVSPNPATNFWKQARNWSGSSRRNNRLKVSWLGTPFSQPEKLAEEVVLGLDKDRHIHCGPAARQYGAERDHHHIEKIAASGAARSWIFQFGKPGVEAVDFPSAASCRMGAPPSFDSAFKIAHQIAHNINNISTIHQRI
jgi:hypothetical protein